MINCGNSVPEFNMPVLDSSVKTHFACRILSGLNKYLWRLDCVTNVAESTKKRINRGGSKV